MSDNIVLGYWGIRGRGQVLRHLLSYSGLKFQQKIYKSPEEYAKDIGQLGKFPNLPYLRDGDFVFSQTLAIARYIARRGSKPQLLGKTPAQQAMVDNYIYAFDDLFIPIMSMFFNKKVNDVKTGHYYKIKSHLQRFDKFINGKSFIFGYPTIADFFLSQYSYYIQKLYPEQFTNYKSIITVRQSIENLAQVKKYYERTPSIKTPFLPPNKTTLPFFWPGTHVAVPPPPAQKYSVKKVEQKPVQSQQIVSSQPIQQPKQIVHDKQPQENWDQQVQFYAPQAPHKVAVISGSVSGNSTINYLMGQITSIGHPAFQFNWCDISVLQLHNQDIEDGTDNANGLRGQVYECQAVLFGLAGTHSMLSAALTNVYNWLVPVLKQKPIAFISVQIQDQSFRKALDAQSIPYMKSAKMSVRDPSTFFNQEGAISGPSLTKTKNFFNKFAQFIETGS